jgi:NAD(P)-dependent dehydrogenase (short-subunit alcohol dehydrogenase family)
MLLKDKIAIVTGSGRGIGKGIALRLAQEGAKVVVNGRDAELVESTAVEIRKAGGVALEIPANLAIEDEVEQLFAKTIAEFGALDILVNNAQMRVGPGERGPFLHTTSEGWNTYVMANMGMLYYCTHRAAKIMAQKRNGSIVNISSNGAIRAHRQSIPYDAVKGAVEGFTRAVAVDLAPWGVRVNAIRPVMIAVESWDRISPDERQRWRETVPMGRDGRPADVAWAVVFLSSDDASFITGTMFEVDGGSLAQSRPPIAELIRPVAGPENINT